MSENNKRALTAGDVHIIEHVRSLVILDALVMKGVLTYEDIQQSIAAVRERIPGDLYSQVIADTLNMMEQTWQDSVPYQSPLAKPGDPQP